MSGQRWVCRLCVMARGIRGSELRDWPLIDDLTGQAEHLEREHHLPVIREGETEADAVTRLCREQPGAGDPLRCRCPQCMSARELS